MKRVKCPCCGAAMRRNGRTTAGAQRWRCESCGASGTVSYDDSAARLGEFLAWLLSKATQADMPGRGRTFRRLAADFWPIWPMPEPTGEVHRVLFLDGIWLARSLVVLIAYDGERVVSWYMAQSETSRAWEALMSPIPAPDVVVCDGGTGFASAVRRAWPRTRVQRCLFHAFSQVRRYATSRPKLQAGRELYALSVEFMRPDTLRQADWWVERYLQRCGFWADFLEGVSYVDGRRQFTHERLRKARPSLSRPVSAGTLFTYLDPGLTAEGPLPRTDNPIEGGVNAQLRDILRNHRGLSLMRRVKAVFWWCYMHTENPRPAREILRSMPTDDDIGLLCRTYTVAPKREDGGPEWGDRAVWEELHHRDPYPFWLD
ncbi:IS1249 family transposase [Collinsella tanakaei]|uniref:IS1249 family transposase n=1 Tax=Collinsella tanakaei TaxID=626935 RepID=UPI0025A40F8F|nr:IS1249 family transposase [Collinsella tanakaei]MDM8301087.1 IS1249 family transposase [Collinsella tanakaei]